MYNKHDWRFDEKVVGVFDSHVRKSVPLYEHLHKSIIEISKYFIRPETEIIDVGTSTGYFINSIYEENINRDNTYIGIDIEKAMITECHKRYKDKDIGFLVEDAITYNYGDASVITMFLLLQFLERSKRIELLEKIYNEVKENTALFIVEKIKTPDIDIHDIYNDLYYDFKKERDEV